MNLLPVPTTLQESTHCADCAARCGAREPVGEALLLGDRCGRRAGATRRHSALEFPGRRPPAAHWQSLLAANRALLARHLQAVLPAL